MAALPGPALNIGQRRVLNLTDRQVVVLQLAQPVAQRLLRIEGLNHRQGVDEQAQHVLRAWQLGRAPRHGGAESHAALPGMTLQQQQPGRLHQRVQRHPLLSGKRVQTAGRLAVQIAVKHAVAAAAGVGRIGQHRRRLQRLQACAPEPFGQRHVLLRQPVDVIGIAPGQRWQGLVRVQAQHLAEQT